MCWVFWGSVVQLRSPSQLHLKLDEPKMAQDWPHGDQEGPEMTQDKAKMEGHVDFDHTNFSRRSHPCHPEFLPQGRMSKS